MTDTAFIQPAMLTTAQYAAQADVSIRTVKRWLEAEEIQGAQLVGGRWQIPSGAPRVQRLALVDDSTEKGTAVTRKGHDTPSLGKILDHLPAMLTPEQAAHLIHPDLSAHYIRSNPEEFDARKWSGRWLVPAATVRRLAGL